MSGPAQQPRTRRERKRLATYEEIRQTARTVMAAEGTAGVSLRAIAAEMGLTPPALYRYYASRDDLLTALIIEDYNALGEALEQTRDAHRERSSADQFYAVGLAYRAWAIAHPTDYELILGNPIPGYHAPAEITQPAARRGLGALLAILVSAWNRGELATPPEYAETPAAVEPVLEEWRRELGLDAPAAIFRLAVALWGRLHGLILLELFGHLGPLVGDPASFFEAELRSILATLDMHVEAF
ncbi:MAG TPA: TetR/AcrR family transcriptional regulator [Ktedonobacterales bacterium]